MTEYLQENGGNFPPFSFARSNKLAEVIVSTTTTASASARAKTITTEEKKKDNPDTAIIATSVIISHIEQSTAIVSTAA